MTRDRAQDAAWVRAGGGHALKYLVQIRADRPAGPGEPDLAAEGLDVVREVIDDCRAAGVPSVIENLIYPLPGEQLDPGRRAEAIIAAAVALDGLGPDLLKLEYPGSPGPAGGWPRRSAPRGPCCRPGSASTSSPTCCGSPATRAARRASSPVARCGRTRSGWRADSVGAYLADEGRRRLDGCLAAIKGRARRWDEVSGS